MNASEPVRPEHFQPDDREVQKDPYAFYPVLRELRPVLKSTFGDRPCWILSRREDIAKAYADPATFSSRTTPIPNMLFSDPPEQGRLRKMVADMFTRPAVQSMGPHISRKAAELVDALLIAGTCDIVSDFAGPLTVTMIGLMLGIPVLQVEKLREMTKLHLEFVLAKRLGREPSAAAITATEGLDDFVLGLIRSGNYEKGSVVARLAEFLQRGELSEEECTQFVVLLLIAGHTTTSNLISSAIYMIAQRPADLDRLNSDQAFVTPFIEEVLRTRPSFHRNTRVTTREVEVAGEMIPAGSLVVLLIASANRDPAFFEDAETFDPDKKRRHNFSFGHGIHTCMGNWLARLEAATAVETFAHRVGKVALLPERPVLALSGGTFNEFGFESLPLQVIARAHPPSMETQRT